MTGLEPATSGVTGRHSNQLSYTRMCPDRRLFRPEVRLDYGFQFSKSSAEKADRKKYKTPVRRAKLSLQSPTERLMSCDIKVQDFCHDANPEPS